MSALKKTGSVRSLFDKPISGNHDPKRLSLDDELWTMREILAYWKCSRKTADRLLAMNRIPRFGSRGSALLRYRKRDIVAVLEPV